ncbi:unnamed protein product [Musa acuminata var. zebrina]
MRALTYGVDVVVGTPGRIFNLLNRGVLNLSDVQFVVLNETDQMLNVGFAKDVERILEKMPQKHQTMMFSATMPTWIRKLTQRFLKDPINIDLSYCAKVQVNTQHKMHPALLLFINVGESDLKLTEGITLYSIVSDNYAKPSILGPLIKEHAKGGKCIVFTQIKRDVDRLAYAVGRRFGCEVLHGDISQSQRKRTLLGFRDGCFNILIATDIAARGLDIANVDLVIHYELPNTSELFVQRSGRTGQAGKKGIAILIHSYEQNRLLPRITVEDGGEYMIGGRFDSYGSGRMGGSGFAPGGNYGGSGYGCSRGFGGSGSFGVSPSRTGGSSRNFGSYGGQPSEPSGGFGGSSFGHSGAFVDSVSRRPGNFGDSDPGHFGSSFGESDSGLFAGFANSGPGRSTRFHNSSLSCPGDYCGSNGSSFGGGPSKEGY